MQQLARIRVDRKMTCQMGAVRREQLVLPVFGLLDDREQDRKLCLAKFKDCRSHCILYREARSQSVSELSAISPARQCDDDRNADVGRNIKHPKGAIVGILSQISDELRYPHHARVIEANCLSALSSAPPKAGRVALNQFENGARRGPIEGRAGRDPYAKRGTGR
jgi:hypothetical protein